MARRRDERPPEHERPLAQQPTPNRAGALRVTPEPGPDEEVRWQTGFAVGPDMPELRGRRFAVGPHEPTHATGSAGWVHDVPMGDLGIVAEVYYPAEVVVDAFGRVQHRESGENATPAAAFGGWPVVLLVHGVRPSQTESVAPGEHAPSDDTVLCDPSDWNEVRGLRIYKRWASLQRDLAKFGYVSVAPDLADERPAVAAMVEWFVDSSRWSPIIDPHLLGLVGHSAGSTEVHQDYRGVGGRAIAVLGPVRLNNLRRPNLTIGSAADINGETRSTYDDAEGPRHLVRFTAAYAHYAFFDGLCNDGDFRGAARLTRRESWHQRAVTRLALRRFFDRYLRAWRVPDDLGLGAGVSEVETEYDSEDGPVA